VQIVGYDVGVGGADPALLLADEGVVEPEPLPPGRRLEYALGRRRCAGAVDGTDHHACERSAVPRCPRHETTWVCARCTGTCLKAEMDCHREHAVYVAAFAPATFKVGVTGRPDPGVRLREQGADRGAVIRRVENGRIAREIESRIAAGTALVDSVRVPTKVAGMGRSVDEAAWERRLSAFDVERRYDLEYGFELPSSPIAETIADGVVVGTKGRVLVLERGGERFAVDLRSLVGHEVTEGGTDRRLQASLGSFG